MLAQYFGFGRIELLLLGGISLFALAIGVVVAVVLVMMSSKK